MRFRSAPGALSLFSLSPLLIAGFVACASESPDPGGGGAQAGEGRTGASPSAGGAAGDNRPSAGTGGSAGGAGAGLGSGGSSGDAGSGGAPTDAGAGGVPIEAGAGGAPIGGSGGTPTEVSCTNADGTCAEPCHEVPIVTGCGEEQEPATLCTALPLPEAASCGVRLDDGEIFYVDAPYESLESVVPNPFGASEDFRACTQAEVDASDCREHADEPAERSARFVLRNTSTEDRWVLVAGEPCAPFDVQKDGSALVLEPGAACAESACNAIAADWIETETWERVAAGASVTLTWDGIRLATHQTIDVCEPGETATGAEREQAGDGRCVEVERRAAAAGAYSVTFGVRSTDPSLDEAAECEGERCNVPMNVVGAAPIYEACRTTGADTLNVDFTLPETGEAVVNVALE